VNLYLIWQDENTGYDTYDSAVVAANNEEEARRMHPNGGWESDLIWGTWASNPDHVKVRYIGDSAPQNGIEPVFICKSFNAG
jgi:hypothetical protein